MNVLVTSASRKVWLVRAFQQALAEEGGGSVIAVDASPYSAALYVADKAYSVPHGLGEDFLQRVLEIGRAENVKLIVPTRDEELWVFAEAKSLFADAGITIMVADKSVVELCQDKRVFIDHCLRNGLSVPAVLEPPAGEIAFPVFVRARFGKASRAAHRVDSPDELQYLFSKLNDPIVQEYIEAPEYTVDLFSDFAGRVKSVVPRLRMSTFGGESFIGKTVKHPEVVRETIRLAKTFGLVGFNTVQCFWHEDSVKFIEVNPRLGGGANLSFEAGADTPRMALQMMAGKEIVYSPEAYKDGYVMLRYTEDVFVGEDDLDAVFHRKSCGRAI